MKSYIYFIQEGLQGNIKIGISQNPNERIKQLQTGSSTPLRTLLVKEGTQKDEEGLHKKFKKFQLKGEWFNPSEEILIFIDQEIDEIKKEKIVELENKVKNITSKVDKIVELENRVEHLTSEIENLRNQRPIENYPNYYIPYWNSPRQLVYIHGIDFIQTDENKKRILHIRFKGTCDIDVNSLQNGINLDWEISYDEGEIDFFTETSIKNSINDLMMICKIFDFDKFVLKNNNQIVDDDFLKDESNKDSIFDFISSKTFPYKREFFLIGVFGGEYYREENLTSMFPEEVIIPSGKIK